MDSENISVLEDRGTFVWLTADARTLAARLENERNESGQRPSLTGAGALDEIDRVLAERLPVYEAVADLAVDTAGKSPAGIAAEIAAALPEGREHRARKKGRKPHVR